MPKSTASRDRDKRKRWPFYGRISLGIFALTLVAYSVGSLFLANVMTTASGRALASTTPAKFGLDYTEVRFPSRAADHAAIRGWWVPHPGAHRVLIALHPKKADRSWGLVLSKSLWAANYNVLYLDMRGHGISDGDHYSYGQFEQFDILGAIDWLESNGYKAGSIGLIGWSMGAASAILASSQSPDIQAVVSDSSYADANEFVGYDLGVLGFFAPGVHLFSNLLWGIDFSQAKPVEAITRLGDRHIMLIHGALDTKVPLSDLYLLKAAGGTHVADVWVVPNTGHAMAASTQGAAYAERIIAFFNRELHNE